MRIPLGEGDATHLIGKITEPLVRLLHRTRTVKCEECLSSSENSLLRHVKAWYTHDQYPLGLVVLAMISPPLLFPPHL